MKFVNETTALKCALISTSDLLAELLWLVSFVQKKKMQQQLDINWYSGLQSSLTTVLCSHLKARRPETHSKARKTNQHRERNHRPVFVLISVHSDMLFVFGQFYKVVRQLTTLYYHHQQHNKPLEMQWPKETRQWSDFIDDQPRAAQAMHSGSPTCPSHFTCIVVCRHQVINLRSATL